MKKLFRIMPALILTAGLAGVLHPGSSWAREQGSPKRGSDQMVQAQSGFVTTAPRGLGEEQVGEKPAGGMQENPEGEGVGTGSRGQQEEYGVAPQFEEESGQIKSRPQEQLGVEPEKQRNQELAIPPETGGSELPEAGRQGQSSTEPEERRVQKEEEQYGLAPGFEGKAKQGQGWIRREENRARTGWQRKNEELERGR